MKIPFRQLSHIFRHYGLGFCAYRLGYAIRRKCGLLKKSFPLRIWEQIQLSDYVSSSDITAPETFLRHHANNGRRFFFAPDDVLQCNAPWREAVREQAEPILHNCLPWFFHAYYDIGEEPDWFTNPLTGYTIEHRCHWCDIPFFNTDAGDIKFYWEPSRFAWAYILTRAYAATGEERYAEHFWKLWQSWRQANPPNLGPNYACGQECAIRLMALCFAYYGLQKAASSTSSRLTELVLAIAVHARRIDGNIAYAISTRTNHSLTEAAGLYTAGLLFPEFTEASSWRQRGKRILIAEAIKQIAADGTYIQQSINYHRLMLQVLIWTLRLGQLNGDAFPKMLQQRFQAAVDFLLQMQNDCGHAPLYGANDGALIMPLNTCDYLDMRPVTQAGYYLCHQTKCFAASPVDEDMIWLFGPDAASSPAEKHQRKTSAFTDGGYYTIINNRTWGMIRCHSFSQRPGHADSLHFDLWRNDCNLLGDSGSYMYFSPPPWQDYFTATSAHNTAMVDHMNQMDKASRFMWINWLKAHVLRFETLVNEKMTVFEGWHNGFTRLHDPIIHKRCIISLDNGMWIVIDDFLGMHTHDIELFWHMGVNAAELTREQLTIHAADGPVYMQWLSNLALQPHLHHGHKDNPLGWTSRYYGYLDLSPCLQLSAHATLPCRIMTLVSMGQPCLIDRPCDLYDQLTWRSENNSDQYRLNLHPLGDFENTVFISLESCDSFVST